MRLKYLLVVAALSVCPGAPAADIVLQQRETAVRAAISEFYVHLNGEHAASKCPDLLLESKDTLLELPAAVRASLGEADADAAMWTYLRRYRRAISVAELQPPYQALNVRFISRSLDKLPDPDHPTVEIIGGATEHAQTSGVMKHVAIGLTWSERHKRYLISPLGMSVNGVTILPAGGYRPDSRDLWSLLGFERLPGQQ